MVSGEGVFFGRDRAEAENDNILGILGSVQVSPNGKDLLNFMLQPSPSPILFCPLCLWTINPYQNGKGIAQLVSNLDLYYYLKSHS